MPEITLETYKDQDVFACSFLDVPEISPEIACHGLNIDPSVKAVHRRKWPFSTQRVKIVVKEVNCLLQAKVIRKVTCPKWLASAVMVPKKKYKWRV